MAEINLAELVEHLGKFAQKLLLDDDPCLDELIPMYHLICPEQNLIVGCPWQDTESKLASIEKVRLIAKEHHARAAGFLSEAWTVKVKPEEAEYVGAPSEHPNRIEVVIAVATDGFNSKGQMWEMKRNEDGKLVSLVADDMPDGFQGRILEDMIPLWQ